MEKSLWDMYLAEVIAAGTTDDNSLSDEFYDAWDNASNDERQEWHDLYKWSNNPLVAARRGY